MTSLETKSQELKNLAATYDTGWLLGDLYSLIYAGKDKVKDQLGKLSSPMRQLYYLAGLNVTSDPSVAYDNRYDPVKWDRIIILLNEIEEEYHTLLFANDFVIVPEEWQRIRRVAVPSFLAYFNQGPLNYEEQSINWVRDLFTPLDSIIEKVINLKTNDFIEFYQNIDRLRNDNFQSHTSNPQNLRYNWNKYSRVKLSIIDNAPDWAIESGKEKSHLYAFLADRGMIDRFYPKEIVSNSLPLNKIEAILELLSTERAQTDYLYYTSTKPGNPLFEKPIINIDNGLYQVFEVKQVIHAIEKLLNDICNRNDSQGKYTKKKGKVLERKIKNVFLKFFGKDCKIYESYYVDGHEQDILILWKKYAFIIEAKGYSRREPLRDPEKAFPLIKREFDQTLGYAYKQSYRVESKFINSEILRITNKKKQLVEEIDTTLFDNDFSIIVNLNSFGQIQCDLSALLNLENENDVYPWAVKLDDLETFLLTMTAKHKGPKEFIDFLLVRESLHGKLFCSDELDICAAFLQGGLKQKFIDTAPAVLTTPGLGKYFDKQYRKIMGFEGEKYLDYEKNKKKRL